MQPNPYEGQPQQQPIQQEYTQGAAVQNQEWQASLCSCSPIDSCCLAYWLPCILIGKTTERMRDPTMQTYEAINTDCLLYGAIQCFTGCGWIYALVKRGVGIETQAHGRVIHRTSYIDKHAPFTSTTSAHKPPVFSFQIPRQSRTTTLSTNPRNI